MCMCKSEAPVKSSYWPSLCAVPIYELLEIHLLHAVLAFWHPLSLVFDLFRPLLPFGRPHRSPVDHHSRMVQIVEPTTHLKNRAVGLDAPPDTILTQGEAIGLAFTTVAGTLSLIAVTFVFALIFVSRAAFYFSRIYTLTLRDFSGRLTRRSPLYNNPWMFTWYAK